MIIIFVVILAGVIGYFAWKIDDIKKRLIKRLKTNVTNMYLELNEAPELMVHAKSQDDSNKGKQAQEEVNKILTKAYDAGEDESDCSEQVESLCDAVWDKVHQNPGNPATVQPYLNDELCVRDKLHTQCGIIN